MQFLSRIHLFDAFGIPIYIDFSFLFLLAFFVLDTKSMELGIGCALILATSVALHELGHSLTARAFGYQTRDITISLLGGCASLIALPQKPWQEFLTAAAGPFVSFLLAGLAVAADILADRIDPEFHTWIFSYVFGMNLVLGVFNLLPGFPMDGGRVFRSVMSMFIRKKIATLIAMWVGRVFAVLLALSWVVPSVIRHDYGSLLLLIAIVLWIGGDRIFKFILGKLIDSDILARFLASPLRTIFVIALAVIGYHLSPGGGFGLIRLLIAWMIWQEGYREYLMVKQAEDFRNWTQDDFDARVSPPPYDR